MKNGKREPRSVSRGRSIVKNKNKPETRSVYKLIPKHSCLRQDAIFTAGHFMVSELLLFAHQTQEILTEL